MTLNEALSTGLVTTGVGMLIVFSVLAILMCVLMLMKVVFYKDPAKAQKKPEVKEAVAENCDDDELIAVLTAAVAASLNTSTYNLKIKSYKRIDNKAPAWRRAGITDTVNQY